MGVVGRILKVLSIIGMVFMGLYFVIFTIDYSNIYHAIHGYWDNPSFFSWLIEVLVVTVCGGFLCLVSYYLGVLFVNNE